MRANGVKCILRFAYTNDLQSENPPFNDAATAQTAINQVEQLRPVVAKNADVIAFWQAGFVGTWGEWYYTDSFGFPSDNLSTRNVQDRRSLIAKLVDVAAGIPVLVRTPAIKRSATQQTTAVTESEADDGSSMASKVGHHNDCFLASSDDFGTYVSAVADKQFVASDTTYTSIGGETCAVNSPRSDCTSALAELEMLHYTFMNSAYEPNVLSKWKSQVLDNDLFRCRIIFQRAHTHKLFFLFVCLFYFRVATRRCRRSSAIDWC